MDSNQPLPHPTLGGLLKLFGLRCAWSSSGWPTARPEICEGHAELGDGDNTPIRSQSWDRNVAPHHGCSCWTKPKPMCLAGEVPLVACLG